jgi:hypothetical protein
MSTVSYLILSQVCVLLFAVSALARASVKSIATETRLNSLIARLGSGFFTQTNQGAIGDTYTNPQGAVSGHDPDNAVGAAGTTYNQGYQNAQSNRINLLITDHNLLQSDTQAAVDRINAMQTTHNNLCADVQFLADRVNNVQNMLRSAGMMG